MKYEVFLVNKICGSWSQIYDMSVKSKPNYLVSQRGVLGYLNTLYYYYAIHPGQITWGCVTPDVWKWCQFKITDKNQVLKCFDKTVCLIEISDIMNQAGNKASISSSLVWCIINYLQLLQLFTHKNNCCIAAKTRLWQYWQTHNSNIQTQLHKHNREHNCFCVFLY